MVKKMIEDLFGKDIPTAPDMDQALKILKENADPNDPVGTIIWMNVDDDGNAMFSRKVVPQEFVPLNYMQEKEKNRTAFLTLVFLLATILGILIVFLAIYFLIIPNMPVFPK